MKPDLERYFAGELDEAESLGAQLYIAENPDDPQVLELSEKAFEAAPVKAGRVEDIHAVLGIGKKRNLWRIAAVVASAAVSAAAVVMLVLLQNRPVEYLQVVVPDCSEQSLTLSDGTVLTLGSGTSLIYPSEFNGRERTVFLDGQVYASVSHDPRHPFVIHSGGVDVKVFGTEFNFKSWTDSDQVELCLLEGSVSMAADSREVKLSPGDMVRYSRRSHDCELSSFDADDYGPDCVNSLRFHNEQFSEICSELEKVFGVRIVILDEKLSQQRFFSYFTNGESLDEILAAINPGTFTVSRIDERLITIRTK